MISVTVSAGDIQCTVEWDSKDWSPDVVLDMTRRATASIIVAAREIDVIADDDDLEVEDG